MASIFDGHLVVRLKFFVVHRGYEYICIRAFNGCGVIERICRMYRRDDAAGSEARFDDGNRAWREDDAFDGAQPSIAGEVMKPLEALLRRSNSSSTDEILSRRCR